mgnify:CR=1 FL=1
MDGDCHHLLAIVLGELFDQGTVSRAVLVLWDYSPSQVVVDDPIRHPESARPPPGGWR